MREILFRGKRNDNGEWVVGDSLVHSMYKKGDVCIGVIEGLAIYSVIPESVSEFVGLTDKNGTKIFEGDIVQYQNLMEFDIQSVVKFGEYKQDGSSGEYGARNCLGFYVEVDNFTCPDWCENQPECFNDYWATENLLQVNENCEVIGNIHDNPELLGGAGE